MPVQQPAPRLPWASALLTRLFVWTPVSLGRLIYFDAGGAPQEQPLVFHFTWQGFIMAPYRIQPSTPRAQQQRIHTPSREQPLRGRASGS